MSNPLSVTREDKAYEALRNAGLEHLCTIEAQHPAIARIERWAGPAKGIYVEILVEFWKDGSMVEFYSNSNCPSTFDEIEQWLKDGAK